MRSQCQKPELSQSFLSAIWIRSGGRCECSSSCAHHENNQCRNQLVPGNWSARGILPAWMNQGQDSVSMFEALCESCSRHQDLLADAAAGSRARDAALSQAGNGK